MPPTRRIRLFVGAALVVFALDVITKQIAVATLTGEAPQPLIGEILTLRLTRNPGAAFSVATGYTSVLTVVSIVVILVVIWLARRVRSRLWAAAFGMLVGGAAGNLSDRLLRDPGPMRGHVVDFLELPNWPVFNLGDSAIVVAAALIVLQSFRGVRLDGTRARA